MATYYCDLDSDYTDATGADHAGNEYTGVGGLQAAIRGTGNATALSAGDTLYVKGTGNLGRLVQIDVGTDITGTGLGWALGDEVENDIGSGDDWTGVICEVGVGGDTQTILVELDSGYTTSDVDDADGVGNTTQSEGWNPQDSHSCPGITYDGANGDTTTGRIRFEGVASDWSTGEGDTTYCATLDGQSVATYCWRMDDEDFILVKNFIFQNASGNGAHTGWGGSRYWIFDHCIAQNNGSRGFKFTNLSWIGLACIFRNNSAHGVYYAAGEHYGSLFIGNGDAGIFRGGPFVRCIFHDNAKANWEEARYARARHCIFDAPSSGDNIIIKSGDANVDIRYCYITNAPAYGIDMADSLTDVNFEDYNVFYNNTSGDRNNIAAGDHSESAASDPYVDRANDDFRLTADAPLAGEQAAAIDIDWTDAIHPNTAYITAGIPREYQELTMANKIYVHSETPTVWSDTAGDKALTLNNLASGAGRVGAQLDLGSGARSEWYDWRLTVQFETAPVVGQTVEVYLSTSDGSEEDGQEGTTDAALGGNDSLKNMVLIGTLTVTSTDASHDMTASGMCHIPQRYAIPVIYNNTDDNLKATNDTGEFTLTPIPPEVQ